MLWPDPPHEQDSEHVLAEIDEFGPTAAEPLSNGVRIHFASPAARDQAAAHLRALDLDVTCSAVDLPDEHWAERSQAALRAITVGALTIAPPWDVPPRVVHSIVITPSMGFGTGHHATTRMCLALLQERPMTGRRVLDVGTGSGVLAIAAWRLGANRVLAIDNDAHALEAAAGNVAGNGATDAIELRRLDVQAASSSDLPAGFDAVLANLTGAALTALASSLVRFLAPGGTAVVSGLLAGEEASVAAAFQAAGANVTGRRREDEWVALTVSR